MNLRSTAAALLCLLACTEPSPQGNRQPAPRTEPSARGAGDGNPARPDAGLLDAGTPQARVLPSLGAIPGSYIVLLQEQGPDGKPVNAHTVAQRLAERYGGKVTFIYETLPGFALDGLSEEKAAALEKEPEVASIEQDRAMQLIGPIKSQQPRP